MTVRELLKEILVSGCSLDDQLCLVTKFDFQQVHHERVSEEEEAHEDGPLAEHLMRAMCQPDHVDLTIEHTQLSVVDEKGRGYKSNTVIMEFGNDK